MYPAAPDSPLWGRAALPAAVGTGAIAAGLVAARGSLMSMLFVAALGGAALVLVFARLGPGVLWVWALLSVVTYPLNGFLPGAGSQQPITFDRAWLLPMVGLLLALPRHRGRPRASRRLSAALLALTVVMGLRTALTPGTMSDRIYVTEVWVDSLVLPLIIFCLVRRLVALDHRNVERAARWLMVAGAALAVIGIAERVLGFELATLSGSTVRLDENIGEVRISGPYPVPEVYGLSLLLCLAMTMQWLLMARRTSIGRLVAVTIIVLELVATFLTFFRVGWLGAVAVVIAATGVRPRRYGRAVATVGIVALIAALAYTQLDRFAAVSSRAANTQTIFTRFATYEQGLRIFTSAPVLGVGASRYTAVALSLPHSYVGGAPSVEFPHSSFVGTLAEDGLVGFGALLFALVAILRAIRALRRRSATHADEVLFGVAVGGGVAYLVYSLTLTMLPYGPSNAFMAVLLGVLAGRLDALGAPAQAVEKRTTHPRAERPVRAVPA
jgi:O-Antigen ligase